MRVLFGGRMDLSKMAIAGNFFKTAKFRLWEITASKMRLTIRSLCTYMNAT